ncbi:MAG: signal peptidase II [Candidatus Acidiferrales bacterium]
MATRRRSGLWWHSLVALGALAADQVSKFAVEKFTVAGSQRVLVPGLLNLVHMNNPGVAFGLFADSDSPWLPMVLIVFSAGVILFLVWLLQTGRAGGSLGQAGMALILGGAAGNVFDRVLRRGVTDFIDFHIGNHHWYTFNVADSAIVIGAGFVLIELLSDWKRPSHQKA